MVVFRHKLQLEKQEMNMICVCIHIHITFTPIHICDKYMNINIRIYH